MENNYNEDTFLARWLSGDLSEAERQTFEASEEYRAYQKIAEASAELRSPEWQKAAGWEALEQQMNPKPKPQVRRRQLWPYAVAAATVLLLIAFWFWGSASQLTRVGAELAEQKQVALPDGSQVWLNAGSEIAYDATAFASSRQLNLRGEAYFEVARGSQFTVRSAGGAVRVLGTRFVVYDREEKIEVRCYAGKVGLRLAAAAEEAVLLPGDRFWSEGGRAIQRAKLEPEAAGPAWRAGESRFDLVALVEVIRELERQYRIEVQYPPELAEINDYRGGFPHDDLETALKLVFSAVGYQYRIDQNRIEVYR